MSRWDAFTIGELQIIIGALAYAKAADLFSGVHAPRRLIDEAGLVLDQKIHDEEADS